MIEYNSRNFFIVGSSVLVSLSVLAMIIAKKLDNYSIKYQRLSYTGVRSDFQHPRYDKIIPANSYPEILNVSLMISGFCYMIGFLMFEDYAVNILGGLFGLFIIIIGIVDVSGIYKVHLNSVFGSQIVFGFLCLYISIAYQHLQTFLVILLITFLTFYNSYTRRISGSNSQQNVIAQKLFIYIEAIYVIFLPGVVG